MNFLGMGPLEILLIVVIALIVFGPARLPEIMGQVGRTISEFRRATSQLSDEFNRTIQAELQETRAVVEDTRSAVTNAQASINSAMGTMTAPIRTATPTATVTVTAPNGTGQAAVAPNGTTVSDTTPWSWEGASPPAGAALEETLPMPVAQPAPLAQSPRLRPAPSRSRARDDLQPPY